MCWFILICNKNRSNLNNSWKDSQGGIKCLIRRDFHPFYLLERDFCSFYLLERDVLQALSHNFYLTFSDSFKKLKFSPILFEFVSSFVFIFPTGPFRGLRSGPADVAPAGQALSGQLASQPPQLVFVYQFFSFSIYMLLQLGMPILSGCITAVCTVKTVI